MPAPNTGIHVVINSVDQTSRLYVGGGNFTWNDLRQSRASTTIPLILAPADTYAPSKDWSVEIYETNADRVWIGTILGFDVAWLGNDGWRVLSLSCVGLVKALDSTQLPDQKITSPISCGSLLTSQFGFISGSPLTIGTIDAGATIPNIDISGTFKDLADKCATLSGFKWWIDPRDATFNFQAFTANPAAYTIDSSPGLMLWETLKWKQSAEDSRDQQSFQVAATAAPTAVDVFEGDGSTQAFTLAAVPSEIVSAVVTGSTQASASGTFTATNMSPGDMVMIAGSLYMGVASLDDSLFGQVLIGINSQSTAQNLVDAINAKPSQLGVTVSRATWANLSVTAGQPTGSPARTFVVRARVLGQNGNGITLSASVTGACFSWSSGTTSGGSDILPGGTFQLFVNAGSDAVTVTPAMPVGTKAVISYLSDSAPTLTAGSGTVQRRYTLDNSPTMEAALQLMQAVLNQYNGFPATADYESDVPGLYVCDYAQATITYPLTAPALINGFWVIQEVQAQLIPGKDSLNSPYNHFRYTYQLINSAGVPPFTQFIDALAAVGGTGQTVQPVPTDAPLPIGTRIAQITIYDATTGTNNLGLTVVTTPYTTTSPISHSEDVGVRVLAVVGQAITSDYTITIKKDTKCTSPPSTETWTITVPSGTPVREPQYTTITGNFCDGDVLYGDIIASDGQASSLPIIIFTIEWEP